MAGRDLAGHDASPLDFQQLKRIARRTESGRPGDASWSSRYLFRPLSIYCTWLAVRLGMPSVAVSLLASASLLTGAMCYGTPWPAAWLIGAALVMLFELFDHADGEVARVERWRTSSLADRRKEFFDTCSHAAEIALVLAIAMRLYFDLGGPFLLLAVAVLRLFPGAIQPWQRYCEIIVRIEREERARGHPSPFPDSALQVQSLAEAPLGAARPRPMIRALSAISRLMGFPHYLLTLVACTVLDVTPGAPKIVFGGVAVPWLLPWVVVTCVHSAAAGVKSTFVYSRRLKSIPVREA